jgi:Putative adhesin
MMRVVLLKIFAAALATASACVASAAAGPGASVVAAGRARSSQQQPRAPRPPSPQSPVSPPSPPSRQLPPSPQSPQSVAVEPDATVIVCVESGGVTVRGWGRGEVRASAAGPGRVDFRRADGGAGAARRVEVVGSDGEGRSGCSFAGGITLDVPRGSFVQVKNLNGGVQISGVAGVRVETLSGDVDLQQIARSAEAATANGRVSLRKSAGRARLRTISGPVAASEVGTVEALDDFSARTTSGDITLSRLAHAQVEAVTTSGEIEWTGALAGEGNYTLRSYSSGVTLKLPADSSFALSARVSHAGEIVTEFPIRRAPGAAQESLLGGVASTMTMNGLTGPADKPSATLRLTSFSGAIRLLKAGGN